MKVRAFCALLEDSDLLDPDFREQFSRRADACAAGDDAAPLAQWLVEKGWLTPWQAQQLLDGFSTFRLGRYVLLEALGQGGMGAVYKACHPAMGRTVAVKILSDARLSNPRAVARFQREMQAAARLDHPNIISAHDAGLIGDQHFLVMEYAEGQDLNAWQKHYGKIPVVWACEFIRQAAMGLQHAHEQGMVHRDIKPANLLVIWSDPDSLPILKILDLGLARLIAEAQPDDHDSNYPQPPMEGTVTQDGAIVGTPDYLSPEQIEGRSVDVRSDLFSLGCTFFKILTGQIPFGGKSLMDKIHNRTSRSAPPAMALRSLLPEAPPEVEAIVKKLLERDPAKRFQTPQEVAAALAPYTLRALRAERRKKAARKPVAEGSAAAGSTTVAHGAGGPAPVGGAAANGAASTVSATDFAAPSGASAGYSSLSAAPVITPLPPAVWAASGASSGTQPTLGGSNDTPSSNGVRPGQPSTHAPPAVWPEGPPRLPEPGVDWRGMPQMSALEADAASGEDHSREFLRLLARQNGQVQDLPLDGFVPPPPFKAPSDPFKAPSDPLEALEALSVRPSPADLELPPLNAAPLNPGPLNSAPMVSPPPQPRWARDGEKTPSLDVSDSFAPPPPGGLWAPPEPQRAVEQARAAEPARKSVAAATSAVNGSAPPTSGASQNMVVQPGRPVALPYPPPSSSSIGPKNAHGRGVPAPRSGLGNGPHGATHAASHNGSGHNGAQAATYASAMPQASPSGRGHFQPMGGMPLIPQGPLVAGSPAWGGVSAGPPSSSLSSVLPNPAFPFGEPGKGGGGTRYSRLREAAQRRRWWQRNGAAVAFLTAIAVLAIACCALMAFSQGPR